jgi:ribosome-associated protein
MKDMKDVAIGPNGIRLGQFLKYVNAVETGGEVKWLLESGVVTLNGAVEIRRGAQLGTGDVVAANGKSWRVV